MNDPNESNRNVVELVSSEIERAKEEILKELKSKDPLLWRIISIILPIILTSIIGLIIWIAQSSIEESINTESSKLTARLSLAQDLYKQRLKAYMELYDSVISVESSLNDSRIYSESRQNTEKSIEKLSNLSNSNKLLVSPNLYNSLIEMWSYAVDFRKVMDIEHDSFNDLLKSKEKIETQMREDLLMDKLSLPEVMK